MRSAYCIAVTLILFFITNDLLFAQQETNQRILGYKYILDFDSGNPSLFSTSNTFYDPLSDKYKGPQSIPYVNSICDTMGKALFYYDGFSVYHASGVKLSNGDLHTVNFSSYYNYSLIIPIEESNRRYYYLFETVPYEAGWDYALNTPLNCSGVNKACYSFYDICKLQYHVIDMQANGGIGEVMRKHIVVADSVAPSISGVKHQNTIDTWVNVLKYRTNILLNFKVNACGVGAPVVNVIPDFEYKDSPFYVTYSGGIGYQAVFSPSGDFVAIPGNKVSDAATMANPHDSFLFIAPFDNSTGSFDFSKLTIIPVGQAGSNANLFSHDSKYLYYFDHSIFANAWLYQYDLKNNVSIPVLVNSSKNKFIGMDYGKENDLLIYKWKDKSKGNGADPELYGYLGRITSINTSFSPANRIDSLNSPGVYFPFDPLPQFLFLSRNNYIYDFYHPDYKKPSGFPMVTPIAAPIRDLACYSQPVHLAGHSDILSDSLDWSITNKVNNYTQFFKQDTMDVLLSPGNYSYTVTAYKHCVPYPLKGDFTLEDYPSVHLTADSLYTCESKPITLLVNTPYQYHWYTETGDSSTETVQQTGEYKIVVYNSCGSAADSVYVTNSELNVMNLLTANEDGQNDCLYAVSNNPEERIILTIFNNWGSKIFYSTDYQNNWCPESISAGVYYYQASYNNGCEKKGWVQVVK